MYQERLYKAKAHIKVPTIRSGITSPSPVESINSSISTHSSNNTLSPTISNSSSNDNQSTSSSPHSSTLSSSSSTSSTNGSRSRSSSTDITTNNKLLTTQKMNINIKNEPRKHKSNTLYPILYECYAQARVRCGCSFSSQHLTDLPVGSIVTVEEIRGQRARISAPIHGWLSVISKDGNTIILPLNKHTAKIGGKVMFNYRYHGNNIPITAKIVDYNKNIKKHKVLHKNGSTEWIDLKNDKNVTYIAHGVSSMVNPIKHTEKFFLQFFMKDYPQFIPKQQSSSNKNNHYQTLSQQLKAEQLRQAQILQQLHHKQMQLRNQQNTYPSNSKQFKLNGHNHGSASYSKHSQHSHHISSNQKILHQLNRYHIMNTSNNQNNQNIQNNNNNNNHRYHSNGIDKNQNGNRCYNNNNNLNKMRYNALNTMKALNAKKNSEQQCKDDMKEENNNNNHKDKAAPTTTTKKKTDPEEFRRKIKEIERKIIDHLHKRGYYEDSKEFWIYIRKAKEMAIEKAKKERAKYLAREKAEAEAREKREREREKTKMTTKIEDI